jgi:hypothetical protein
VLERVKAGAKLGFLNSAYAAAIEALGRGKTAGDVPVAVDIAL